jgi:hypothetical protein
MPRPKLNVDPGTVRKAEEELSKIKESKLAIQLKGIIAAQSIRLPTYSVSLLEASSDGLPSSRIRGLPGFAINPRGT